MPAAPDAAGHGSPTLSIGALASLVGIPAATLRTWERRYGAPKPVRLASGHRRYATAWVEQLALVPKALAHGLRPGQALALSSLELRQRLGQLSVGLAEVGHPSLAACLNAVESWQESELESALAKAWFHRGADAFVHECAAPLMRAVGQAWQEARLCTAQEHLASQVLNSFLCQRRRELAQHADGARVVCATLPGEQHLLGLQMAALLLARQGLRPLFLGAETPPEECARAVRAASATALLVGSSAATHLLSLKEVLEDLRRQLPAQVHLAVGGSPPLQLGAGLEQCASLQEVEFWARSALLSGGRQQA